MANEQYYNSLAVQIAGMQAKLAAMSQGDRVAALGFSSIEDDFLPVYDALGQARQLVGRQNDGNFGVTYGNGDPPPKPSDPLLSARQLSIVVGWDGEFAPVDGVKPLRPSDLARVDVHVSETPGFIPDGTTVVGSLLAEGALSVVTSYVTQFVKLVAVTTSDVISAPSNQFASIPLPVGSLAAGVIGANQLAATLILSSRIIVGDPTSARVELRGLNDIDAGISSYSANNTKSIQITPTGQFRGFNPQGQKTIEIDANGSFKILNPVTQAAVFNVLADGSIQISRPNGVKSFSVDNTGGVLVQGILRTDDTGQRIELRPTPRDANGNKILGMYGIYFYASTNTDSNSTDPKKAPFKINVTEYVDTDGGTKPIVNMYGALRASGYRTLMQFDSSQQARWSIQNVYSDNTFGAWMIMEDKAISIRAGAYLREPRYQGDTWTGSMYLTSGGTFYDNSIGPQLIARKTQPNSPDWSNGIIFNQTQGLGGGIYQNDYFSFRNWDANGYIPLVASEYRIGSAMDFKDNIQAIPESAMATVRKAPVSRWRYKNTDAEHIGPMADDLPDWATVTIPKNVEPRHGEDDERSEEERTIAPEMANAAIDVASVVGLLWAALREFDQELDAWRVSAKIKKPARRTQHQKKVRPELEAFNRARGGHNGNEN